MPPKKRAQANKENVPAGATPMPGKVKAKWLDTDDEKLVECLQYQRDIGNQSDSGFKSVTWTYAAAELNKIKLGGGDKTANGVKDHWQQQLKAAYQDVDFLLHKVSGFGWDSTRDVVTGEADVWKRLLDAHPKYATWQRKPFPLFNTIAELVGGRTADGRDSLDITEELSVSGDPFETYANGDDGLYHPMDGGSDGYSTAAENHIDPSLEHVPEAPPATQEPPATQDSSSGRKRAASAVPEAVQPKNKKSRPSGPSAMLDISESLGAVAKAFSKAQEDANASTQALVEQATPSHRARAIQRVEKDGTLSTRDRVRLICLFRQNQAAADTFLAISDPEILSEYVQEELNNL